MKKLYKLLAALSLVAVLTACAGYDDMDDDNDENGNTTNGTDNNNGTGNEADEPIPGALPNNGTGNNTGNNTNNQIGSADNTAYVRSLGDIDRTLRTSIGDMDKQVYDVNDPEYLKNTRAGYSSRAAAYRRALDDLNKLNYTGTDRSYHNAVRNYYQGGYDLYNGLYDKYGTFNTLDDESAYRQSIGDNGYRIGTSLQSAYDDALRGMKIDYNE